MNKEAISVYNPSDPIERAVQEAHHQTKSEWLSKYHCQLIADALSSLKRYGSWLNNPTVLNQRIEYFFTPHMSQNKDTMVFLTHPLYLRDILENCAINNYLFYPITLVTTPLAHYLFREYPIHLHFDAARLKSFNRDSIDIGGLLIFPDEDIHFEPECLQQVVSKNNEYAGLVEQIMADISQTVSIPLAKVAVYEKERGVFAIDEHERDLRPDNAVWDKQKRENCQIREVGPGEVGIVQIEYTDGTTVNIGKDEFDQRYITGVPAEN